MATASVGWISFDTLSQYVKDHLQKSQAESLKPYWDSIITAGIRSGYLEIVSAFASRGYLKSVIDQWDRGAEFQQDIGAWWALKRLGIVRADTLGQANLDALDRRKELYGDPPDVLPVILMVGGVVQIPTGTFGQPNFGAIDESRDLFKMDDNDPRRDLITRF